MACEATVAADRRIGCIGGPLSRERSLAGGAALPARPMLIAKLGGSLATGGLLPRWIALLAAAPCPVVVVPGGGPFADAVRAAQGPLGFDDATAHRMALLAMAQFGLAIAAAHPRFSVAADESGIRAALRQDKIPVWSPAPMALEAPEIPASWDVTSDSLAAWLAGRLGAAGLLLVKQVDVAPGSTAQSLADLGIVDPCFPAFLRASGARASVAGPADLLAGELRGTPVAPA